MPILQQNLHLFPLKGTELKIHLSIIYKINTLMPLLKSAPCQKFVDFCKVVENKSSNYPITHHWDTKGDALRTHLKIINGTNLFQGDVCCNPPSAVIFMSMTMNLVS